MRETRRSPVAHVTRLKLDRFTLFLCVLGLLGAASVLLRQVTYGVSLSSDGLIYISVARNLLIGEGFLDWSGAHHVSWGPLWPALLAFFSLPGFDPHDVARFVNSGAFGLTIVISGFWLRRHIESRFLVVWACLTVMVPVVLMNIAVTALSDSVFVLLAALSLIEIEKVLNEGKRSVLMRAAVWTALACLARYVGVAVIFAAVLLLMLDRNAAPIEKAKRIAAYSFIAAAPLCVWMLRNVLLTGDPTGPRGSGFVSLMESVRLTFEGIGRWVFPQLYSKLVTAWAEQAHLGSLLAAAQASAAVVVGAALAILAAAVAISFVRLHRDADERTTVNPLVLFGTFALIYIVFVTVTKSFTLVDNGVRHYVPVYIPLLFVVVFGMDRMLKFWRDGRLPGLAASLTFVRWRLLGTTMTVVLSLWLAYHAVLNVRDAHVRLTEGRGYHSRHWLDSETIRYLDTHSFEGWIYSKSSYLLYWHFIGKRWDRSTVDVLSDLRLLSLPRRRQHLSRWVEEQRAATSGRIYVVWFKNMALSPGFEYNYDIHEIMSLPNLELVAELSDGVILEVNK